MQLETPNLSYIKQLADGDSEFEANLISILKRELPKEKEAFIESVRVKNYQNSATLVHKIKHKISILGLERSYEVAANFENNLSKNNDAGKIDFENVLETITNFLTNL